MVNATNDRERQPRELRVAICTVGRFHHFDLARQLERLGALSMIYSAYPRWKLREERLPREKIKVFPFLQLLYLGSLRMPLRSGWLEKQLAWLAVEALDRYVGVRLPDCDVLAACSGSGLHAGRVARQRGVRYVCDRGSSHIRLQDRLLKDEFALWGRTFPVIDKRVLEKEELEYSLADMVVVPSEFARKSFVDAGVPPGKVRKIPYGVDLRQFRKTGEPDADKFQALFVGGVCFRKGIPYLLQAFKQLRHPRKRLVLTGAILPEMRSFLREQPDLTKDVEFTGPLPRADLPGLMSRSHVLVLPSIEDGFGMVLAEAMACGCPIIGSEHSGALDLITEAREGFVVPIRDPDAIAARLEELAANPGLRSRMSEEATRRVSSMGGWNEYGDAFAAACAELVASAVPGGRSQDSMAEHAQTRHT